MTIAVCVKCGAMKFGALTSCEACGSAPTDEDEFLYSMVLSDHHLPIATLKQISASMLAGLPRPSLPKHQEDALRAVYAKEQRLIDGS